MDIVRPRPAVRGLSLQWRRGAQLWCCTHRRPGDWPVQRHCSTHFGGFDLTSDRHHLGAVPLCSQCPDVLGRVGPRR